jgi:hypothetical protein
LFWLLACHSKRVTRNTPTDVAAIEGELRQHRHTDRQSGRLVGRRRIDPGLELSDQLLTHLRRAVADLSRPTRAGDG